MSETKDFREPHDLVTLFEAGADRAVPVFRTGRRVERTFLPSLNLGAGIKQIGTSMPLDLPEWDADRDGLQQFETGMISVIYAFHVLEHVKRPVDLLWECQRVLATGGVMNIVVPYWRSQGAFHDLDHRHFFTEDTWKNLFHNGYYAKNHGGWLFDIGLNLIMGLNDRNMMLVTQLVKR